MCVLYRLTPREFNSYGARRGNDAVMARGTFANIRLVNKLVTKPGPRTLYIPAGEEMDIFDAAELYRQNGVSTIVLAGKEYGSGSSRDWAAKGPWMLGIKGMNIHDIPAYNHICMTCFFFLYITSFLLLNYLTAVIAESYERIHRSNLVGMGIIPLQFVDGQCAETLGLTGHEAYTIDIPSDLKPGQIIKVEVRFYYSYRIKFF